MIIPTHILLEVSQSTTKQFKDIYGTYIEQKKKKAFTDFLNQVIEDACKELENLMIVTNETLQPIAKRREATKRRWLKKELNEDTDSGFYQEINEVAKFLYDKNVKQFKKAFEVDTLEELREVKKRELQEWFNNENTMVCDFPYLNCKKPKQVELAMVNDIQYSVIKIIMEKCPRGEQQSVVSLPSAITKFPYDHTNRQKLSTQTVEGNAFRSIYEIDNATVFESRLSTEALEEGLMKENLKSLNSLDQDILVYLFSLNHEAMYQPIPMVVEIGEIVRAVYGNDGKKSYLAVKESLIKMDYMELRVVDKSTLRTVKVQIFYSVTIKVDEVSKKEVAIIVFSNDLIHEFVKNQTVSIYKEKFNNFSNSAKVLFCALQRQRIVCASQVEDGEPILFSTNLTYFRGVFLMGTSKRSRQIELIEKALKEIKENEIILADYHRTGDTFLLEFMPFTEKEMRDLLNNNTPKDFLLSQTVESPIEATLI